ncbi:MAG: hypothetical protein WCC92_16410 [Candidatus Korobacteraceae bacterium]
MAKVIEFYKRQDWKPKRESVSAGQHAKGNHVPYDKQEIGAAGMETLRIGSSTRQWLGLAVFGI